MLVLLIETYGVNETTEENNHPKGASIGMDFNAKNVLQPATCGSIVVVKR